MIKILNVTTLLTGMLGALMVASNTNSMVLGYSLFLVSSTTSSILLWRHKDQRGLLALNVFYIGVNVFGLLRYAKVL